jgi:hypothetical protein
MTIGLHELTFFANDTIGNLASSETINFAIAKPFPTELVAIASGVSTAIAKAGLLFYFKKRKHQNPMFAFRFYNSIHFYCTLSPALHGRFGDSLKTVKNALF